MPPAVASRNSSAGKKQEKRPGVSWATPLTALITGTLGTGGIFTVAKTLCDKGKLIECIIFVAFGALLALISLAIISWTVWLHYYRSPGFGHCHAQVAKGHRFLRLPLSGMGKLQKHLRAIHRSALDHLGATFRDRRLEAGQVRLNTFFPDYSACLQGKELLLAINDSLIMNMKDLSERKLRFRSGEGSTGLAYSTGLMQLWRKNPETAAWESGSEQCALQPEQIRAIHRNLDWVISFPIIKKGVVLGVLNIDGLNCPLSGDELYDLADNLKEESTLFVERIIKQRLVTFTICEEKYEL